MRTLFANDHVPENMPIASEDKGRGVKLGVGLAIGLGVLVLIGAGIWFVLFSNKIVFGELEEPEEAGWTVDEIE